MNVVKMTNGAFHEGKHFTKGNQYEVSDSVYNAIRGACELIEQKSEYHYEKSGTWYRVFKGDLEVDHFQGKEKLEEYGLAD